MFYQFFTRELPLVKMTIFEDSYFAKISGHSRSRPARPKFELPPVVTPKKEKKNFKKRV